ncbi:MAG: aryl-sulfate sulfotransferase [Polyangiaceae bacterium]|nr:aryl-sulfate sulfotransferase [Polyangiaceae bacterium]
MFFAFATRWLLIGLVPLVVASSCSSDSSDPNPDAFSGSGAVRAGNTAGASDTGGGAAGGTGTENDHGGTGTDGVRAGDAGLWEPDSAARGDAGNAAGHGPGGDRLGTAGLGATEGHSLAAAAGVGDAPSRATDAGGVGADAGHVGAEEAGSPGAAAASSSAGDGSGGSSTGGVTSGAAAGSSAPGAAGQGGAGNTAGSPPSFAGGGASGAVAGGGASGAAGQGGAGNAAGSPASFTEPFLDDLSVTGVRVPLGAQFDQNRLRYSIIAQDPAQELVVTPSAAPGLTLAVAGIATLSGESVALGDVAPGSDIDIDVSNSIGTTRTYTLVYLPSDFPDIAVTVRTAAASSDPIYLAIRGPSPQYLAKLDNDGVPLFYRAVPLNNFDFKKHPQGELSYCQDAGAGGYVHIVLDSSYTEVARVTTVGLVNTDLHEFHILPNGNYIVLAYEKTTRDMTAYGGGTNDTVADGILQELSPERAVLFEWNSWDHSLYQDTLTPDKQEYAHINSVFVESDGNWLISVRRLSQVLEIDRTTGDVLWRLGGKSNQFTFVNDPFGGLCGPHTVSRLANGHILLFDNGQFCWPEMPERGDLTRIVEYAVDEDAMTAELVWSYQDDGLYTSSQGSAQRLDNGNTLIGWGLTGTGVMVSEVDPEGTVVFRLEAQSEGGAPWSYRAWRFAD